LFLAFSLLPVFRFSQSRTIVGPSFHMPLCLYLLPRIASSSSPAHLLSVNNQPFVQRASQALQLPALLLHLKALESSQTLICLSLSLFSRSGFPLAFLEFCAGLWSTSNDPKKLPWPDKKDNRSLKERFTERAFNVNSGFGGKPKRNHNHNIISIRKVAEEKSCQEC
jgi:hypothetical protein